MEVKPAPPKPRITFKEIAKELGVAVSTVSNAYNRPDQLSPALRERVFETARRLGYPGPNPMARSLARRRAGAVGVVYGEELTYAFSDPVQTLLLEGVAAAVGPQRMGLLLLPGWSDAPLRSSAVLEASVDGFVVHTLAEDSPLLAEILNRGLPTVFVEQPGRAGWPEIRLDDAGGARAAGEHLTALGHRSIGVLSLPLSMASRDGLVSPAEQDGAGYRGVYDRLGGYRAALQAAGLDWRGVAVYQSVHNTPEAGRAAAQTLLAQEPRPTALLCMSDQLALGALEYAAGRGIRVPEELSVVGFDDAPLSARLTPGLTTVHQEHLEKGRIAGETLLALIRGDTAPPSVTLPTRLVVRGTTAPPV